MAAAKNKNNKLRSRGVSRNLDGISDRAKKSQLKFSDLIIPIGAVIILLLLTAFVFMPMIKTATAFRKELKEVKADIEHLEFVEQSLQELDDTKIIDDLLIAKRVIPKVLQVADFVYYIDQLAKSKDLTLREITAGDVSVGSESEEGSRNQGVSSSLSTNGGYDNILDFVDEIQDYSPYLVTLKGMELSMGGETWSVEFDLTGYYVPDRDRTANFHAPFTKYTQFSDIIDIFSVKVQKLDEY